MKKGKQKLIEKLNSETLFQPRKMSGMWGNIQWSVKDIIDGTLIIKISSSSIDWNDESAKNRIARNIEKTVRSRVEDVDVQASWKK